MIFALIVMFPLFVKTYIDDRQKLVNHFNDFQKWLDSGTSAKFSAASQEREKVRASIVPLMTSGNTTWLRQSLIANMKLKQPNDEGMRNHLSRVAYEEYILDRNSSNSAANMQGR